LKGQQLDPADADRYDTALEKLRAELELKARGTTKWDNATRLNNGDNTSVGRLLSRSHDGAQFMSMLVHDAKKDDVMAPDLISDPDLRRLMEDARN
jgi:hypothetical protein